MTSKMRHFENNFEDYTFSNAESVITLEELNTTSKVVTCLDSKWDKVARKLRDIDLSDTSVYTGTSGIVLLKLLKDPTDPQTLLESKFLLGLDRLKDRRPSFLCGEGGPLAIGAVIYHRLGEPKECKRLIDRLLRMQEQAINFDADLPNEYLYGRAGYLYALMYINKNVQPPPIPDDIIREVIEAVCQLGVKEAKFGQFKCPLMYQWHNSYYLGAAHGLSGILYLLLQIKEHLTESELNSLIKPSVDYLASLKFPSGNYPSSLGSENDKYIQWCHGAPGFLYVFTMAYKVFGDQKYLEWALEAGEVIWKRGLLKKGYSICHGVSGNAYCFLELYQTTNDEKHLYRAVKFTEWCIYYTKDHEEYAPDRPLSLFEGVAGPMYLLLDIQKPKEAKFPGYTL